MTINTTGHEKDRFTVMLACTADGGKLPAFAVLKRKTMPKDKFPAGVIVRAQYNGWIDKGLVQDWVCTVWSSRPGGGLSRRQSMFSLDAFVTRPTTRKQCSIGPTPISLSQTG